MRKKVKVVFVGGRMCSKGVPFIFFGRMYGKRRSSVPVRK